MDNVTPAKSSKEQNRLLGLIVVMDFLQVTWEEEQKQWQLWHLTAESHVGCNTGSGHFHINILLEWRRRIPSCFQGANLQMATNIEAYRIQLSLLTANPGSTGQAASIEVIPLSVPLAMLGPELLTALGDFTAKCQQSPPYTGSSYQRFRIFSENQSVPAREKRLSRMARVCHAGTG